MEPHYAAAKSWCAACGGAIGVYERCLVVHSGEPVEISWLSLTEDERDAARAKGAYHRACYSQGPAGQVP